MRGCHTSATCRILPGLIIAVAFLFPAPVWAGMDYFLYVRDATVLKGTSGAVNAVFNVTLSSPGKDFISVDYSTSDGSALAGTDYTSSEGTVTIPPGERTATISVPILGNAVAGPDKQFSLGLSAPSNVTLGTTTATGTILSSTSSISFSQPHQLKRYQFQGVDLVGSNILPGTGANSDMALADLDADGKLDLILPTRELDNSVWLFKGNGDGSFREPVSSAGTFGVYAPTVLAVGDLNNDGNPDYVLANRGASSAAGLVTIALNGGNPFMVINGDEGFAVTLKPLTNYPVGIALGDFNHDGWLDIAVSCEEAYGSPTSLSKIKILLNDGNGAFTTLPIELNTNSSRIAGIVSADFNNDGWSDLAVALPLTNQVRIFINTQLGGFSGGASKTVGSWPLGIAARDLNSDGYPDIVVGNYQGSSISVLMKTVANNGVFANAVPYDAGVVPYDVKLIDLDGDGYPDIVSTYLNGTVILQNQRNGTFASPTYLVGRGESIAGGDIDNDGDTDLVLGIDNFSGSSARVFLNRRIEDLPFIPLQEKTIIKNSNTMGNYFLQGKFSNNARTDIIAVSDASTTLHHYRNNGDGTLADPTVSFAGATSSAHQGAVGDFNSDGWPDFAIAGGTNAYIFLNNGSGGFAAPEMVNTTTSIASITSLHVDDDNVLDLVVSHTSGTFSILRGKGNGAFSLNEADRSLPTGSASAGHMTADDFTGDGKTDLAVAVTNGIAVLPGTATGLGTATTYTLSGTPRIIVSGDFNRDGLPDLAAIITTGGQLVILFNNGSGFSAPAYYTVDTNPWDLSVADIDNDGDLDLLVTSESGALQYFNNIDGTFSNTYRIHPPNSGSDKASILADLDGNGFPDIVVGETLIQVGTNWRYGLFSYRNNLMTGGSELASLTLSAASTSVVTPVTGTVTLDAPAPSGGAVVALSINNICASMPASVTVPAGNSNASFSITPTSNCEDAVIMVGAAYRGSYHITRLHVLPIFPSSVEINPVSRTGGLTASITVRLNAPAKSGGVLVNLSSSSTKVILPSSSISVVAGQSSVTFTITTKAVSINTDVTITASTARGGANGIITLTPVPGVINFDAPYTALEYYGSGIIVADFNQDSKPDLAYSFFSGINFAAGRGDGTFDAPAFSQGFSSGGQKILKSDLNNDGLTDIVVLNQVSPTRVSVFMNTGSGVFAPKVDYTLPGNNYASDMVLGDFNSDGFIDIAINNPGNSSFDSIFILLNNGSGGFVPGTTFGSQFFGPDALAIIDYDGDGNQDLVAIRNTTMRFFQGQGDGTFISDNLIDISSSSGYPFVYRIEVADINNDGYPDLIIPSHVVNASTAPSKEIKMYQNDRFGSFIAGGPIDLVTDSLNNWHAIPITVSDLNGDGFPDIAVAYSQADVPGYVSIALNNGTGLFSAAHNFAAGIKPSGIAAGDFDNDGDLDLAVIHTSNPEIFIYTNTRLTPPADLSVNMTDAPDPVVAGADVTYSIVITNNGPNTAKSVMLSAVLPPGSGYVSAIPSQGSCGQSAGTVTCTVGTMGNAATITVTIVITAPANTGSISNTASVSSSSPDPVPANNSATQSTTVNPLMRLLQVTVTSGSGAGGTVASSSLTATGTPTDIFCANGTCSASYPDSTTVKLEAFPAWHSSFGDWTGCSSATKVCDTLMNSNKDVSASFSLIPDQVLVYGDIGYSSFIAAIGALVGNSSVIAKESYSNIVTETLLFDQGYTVNLVGGMNDLWAAGTNMTSIKGTLSIQSGRVNVNGIALHP